MPTISVAEPEPEPPKKEAAPQHCLQYPSSYCYENVYFVKPNKIKSKIFIGYGFYDNYFHSHCYKNLGKGQTKVKMQCHEISLPILLTKL